MKADDPSAQGIKKQNWTELAASPDAENRKLALELAPAIAGEIQDELLILYAECSAPPVAQRIYELLQGSHREIATALHAQALVPQLRPRHNLVALSLSQNPEVKAVIAAMSQEGLEFLAYKNKFVTELSKRTGMGIRQARAEMEQLFHAVKARLSALPETDEEQDS